jgi:hypothetical protein
MKPSIFCLLLIVFPNSVHALLGDTCVVVGDLASRITCSSSTFYREPHWNEIVVQTSEFDEETFFYRFHFASIEEALRDCPFSPVIIELQGNHYITDTNALTYTKTSDLIIYGVGRTRPTVFNFFDLHIVEDNVNVQLFGWDANGCGNRERGVFHSEHKLKVCEKSSHNCKDTDLDMPCHIGGKLVVNDMKFTNYHSRYILCQGEGEIHITNSNFTHIPMTALHIYNAVHTTVTDNVFCPCAYDSRTIKCIEITFESIERTPKHHILRKNIECR